MNRLHAGAVSSLDRVRFAALKLSGARSKTLETPQGRVHALSFVGHGRLPPVMLFHGLGSAAVDWDKVIGRLRPQCRRICAVDLPGHGKSETPHGGMAPDAFRAMLASATDQLLDEPHILIGNSLGGLAALRTAMRRPDKALALVLTSPGGAPISEAALRTLLERFEMDSDQKARRFAVDCLGEGVALSRVLGWIIRARVARPSVASLVATFSHRRLLTPEELGALEMPILFYWGLADGILGPEHRAFFEAHLPQHAERYLPEHEGHSPHLDGPLLDGSKRFLVPVLDFCRRVASGQAGRAPVKG